MTPICRMITRLLRMARAGSVDYGGSPPSVERIWVYGDLIIICPKPCFIYLRGNIGVWGAAVTGVWIIHECLLIDPLCGKVIKFKDLEPIKFARARRRKLKIFMG